MLTFVQLSDIHFRESPTRSHSGKPVDYRLRDALSDDIVAQSRALGGVSGVLVSGDIAWEGLETEFAQAATWLRELCNRLDIPNWMVWVIPGNHDVFRDAILDSHTTMRAQIRLAEDSAKELETILADPEGGPTLLEPLQNYLAFAEAYNCGFTKDALAWAQLVELEESTLAIKGLSSATISGLKSDEMMVVGSKQSGLDPTSGCLHYVMCHHPDELLIDKETHNRDLKHAQIRVAGHLHRRTCTHVHGGIYLQAGAATPTRHKETGEYDQGQEPTYDLVSVDEAREGDEAYFTVAVRSRRWDDRDAGGWDDDSAPDSQLACRVRKASCATATALPGLEPGPGAGINAPWREVRYRLAGERERNQLRIAEHIGAPRRAIQRLAPHLRVPAIMRWASENARLPELWNEVTSRPADYPGRENEA